MKLDLQDNKNAVIMLALCHSGGGPESVLKMFDRIGVYSVFLHSMHQNRNDIETAVSIDFAE